MTLVNIGFVSHASCGQFPEYSELLRSGNASNAELYSVRDQGGDQYPSVSAIGRKFVTRITSFSVSLKKGPFRFRPTYLCARA